MMSEILFSDLQELECSARTWSSLPSFLFERKQGQRDSKHTRNIPAVVAATIVLPVFSHQIMGRDVLLHLCLISLYEHIMDRKLSYI